MRVMGLIVGTVVLCLIALSPIWAGEADAGEAVRVEQQVGSSAEIPMRPELEAISGVRGWMVNGEEIPIEALSERTVLYYGPYILQDMVAAELLRQEAERRGLTVTEEEVQAKIAAAREELGLRSDAALSSYLRANRLTMSRFEGTARDYMLMEKVLSEMVYVSDQEVERWYNANAALYSRQESVSFRIIRVNSEQAAQETLQQLRQGRSFQEVAAEAAVDARERAFAGELQTYVRGQRPALPRDFEAALFSAPLNQVVGPIQVAESYYLIRVERKTDARQFTLDEVRDLIRTQLRRQKLEQVVYPNWIRMQLAAAEIQVLRDE